jgi:hypothetical protein
MALWSLHPPPPPPAGLSLTPLVCVSRRPHDTEAQPLVLCVMFAALLCLSLYITSSPPPRPIIDPTGLRIALAEHTHFKCQEMNDANELLDTIYECFARSQVC